MTEEVKNVIKQLVKEYQNELTETDAATIKEMFNFPKDNYWLIVKQIPIPSLRAIKNYNKTCVNGFVSYKCAKNKRKVRDCKECLHFFECLDAGDSIVLLKEEK